MTHVLDALGRIKEYWGELALGDLADYVRGRIIRGGAADWEGYAAETNHFILVGDGTDIVSVPFDWDDMAAGAGADMVHDHSAAGEGGTHWGGITQTFGGGSGANIITVPDNLAQALNLVDAGGLEYMRIITTNAGPAQAVVFNNGEVDVNFRVAASGVTNALFVRGSDGTVFINETVNANMAGPGLTINQGANDDEILNLRSSDVGAVYNVVDTNTFGVMSKNDPAAGGLGIRGYRDSGAAAHSAIAVVGYLAENVNTAKTVAGHGIVEIRGFQTDGTNLVDTVADGNVVVFRTRRGGAVETVVIIDKDGDIYYNGALQNYDDEDDALAAWDLSHVLAGAWEQVIGYNRDRLAEMGVISVGEEGRIMISNKRLAALLMGAVGQLYHRLNRLEGQHGISTGVN